MTKAEPIKYELAPLVLADGYELTGGFIETNGKIGDLSPSDITSFSATMDGPIPYVFSSTIPGTNVSISGSIVATADTIFMGLDDGNGVGFGIKTQDNIAPDCQDCHQDLVWLNSSNSNKSTLAYDHHDHSDDDPDSGFKSFTIGRPQTEFTIATLAMEPECVPGVGDFDGNGEVGFPDFLILSANFGQEGGPEQGDADCDGTIGFPDFLVLSANFGQTVAAASVPEPISSVYVVFVLGSVMLLRRR